MESTPKSQKLALGMVMISLVIWGFYEFVGEPFYSRAEMVRKEVQHLEQEILRYQPQDIDGQEWQARIKELEERLEGEHRRIQQEMDQGGFRNRVTRIAQKHQLPITYWQPEASVEGAHDGIKKTPVRVHIKGGYHQMANFFSDLLFLPEVFGISHLTMEVTEDQTHPVQLQTKFVMAKLIHPWALELPVVVPHFPNQEGQGSEK